MFLTLFANYEHQKLTNADADERGNDAVYWFSTHLMQFNVLYYFFLLLNCCCPKSDLNNNNKTA